MTRLFGRDYTKRELLAHVGRVEQVGGIRRYEWSDGFERGVEQFQVRTGAGLVYGVTPSRGLDLSYAELGGVPLTFQSAVGDAHPMFYEPQGTGWLRTFPGGLMTTCGLTSMGSPAVENGESLGLHGRYSHIPAEKLGVSASWQGDEYEMRITGTVRQASFFGEHLELTRTIESRLGVNAITVTDRVENVGFAPCDLMVLYHCNFGFPFVGPDLRLTFPEGTIVPRDEGYGAEEAYTFEAAQIGVSENVFYHRPATQSPRQTVRLDNAALGVSVQLAYSADTLPCLIQWKCPVAGNYALGIEPANALVEGRPAERRRGTLQSLAPGESRQFKLEFSFGR
ncbi:aldose 1-epimerase family protein [Paenibacillus cymbidii]|uniref:aldose 1-epimerase family protein n=1 Tax=Paenibacillus cymbidii TaxID=1639034 RepID=UPI001080965A|nr:aldose 1-epimerase family protein [Paenibacillus cymbidii]